MYKHYFKDQNTDFYAFQNKRTKKFITGTNYSYYPHRQICFKGRPPLIVPSVSLKTEVYCREINLDYYDIVKIEINKVRKVRIEEVKE